MEGQYANPLNAPFPGDYVINSIKCERMVYNGLQARFRIRAGEVINIGAIRFDIRARDGFFVRTTVAHRSTEPLSRDTVTYFKQAYPKTFSRAVNRPMSLVGLPDAEYKGGL